jgi:shikimate kinase
VALVSATLEPARAHLVLVGMMGAGKTTVGRRTAKLLGRPFVDADEAFVARFGRTIAEVFAADGEAAFRDLETEVLATLLGVSEPLVIACGGGVVIREANRRLLAGDRALVVYLAADPGFLAGRATARAHRPLLAGDDPAQVLRRLHAERDPWYRQVADAAIDVDDHGHPRSRRAIARQLADLAAGVAP